MKKELLLTADGSHTVAIPGLSVTYHSKHGAIQESMHVFIRPAMEQFRTRDGEHTVSIFEMGFGTGLNALLSCIEAERNNLTIDYTSIDLHPLESEHALQMNYGALLGREDDFRRMIEVPWNESLQISGRFRLTKKCCDLLSMRPDKTYDAIFFDAFAPAAQPELWTQGVFEKMIAMLVSDGILLTYCSKGDVRRAMMAAGFRVEKIPGPPGKREMVRARRTAQ